MSEYETISPSTRSYELLDWPTLPREVCLPPNAVRADFLVGYDVQWIQPSEAEHEIIKVIDGRVATAEVVSLRKPPEFRTSTCFTSPAGEIRYCANSIMRWLRTT
jgi:hypothetical protein